MKAVDLLIIFLSIKNAIISVLVEEPICRFGADWPKHLDLNPILELSYNTMWPDIDPLLIKLPKFFQLAVCVHFYVLVPLYLILTAAILLGSRWARFIGTVVGGMLLYAMGYALIVEFYGDIPTNSPIMWLVYNIDYLFFALLLCYRFGLPSQEVKTKLN